MSNANDFRLVLIDPQRIAGDVGHLTELVPEIEEVSELPRNLCDLPLIGVIESPDGVPSWEATMFLGYTALRSNSLFGDTVRTYGEALLPWLRYLRGRRIALEDVDEETHGLYCAKVSHAQTAHRDGYASATVNLRIVVPELFHLWGEQRGGFSSPFGVYLADSMAVRRPGWSVKEWRQGAQRSRPRTRVIKRLPVALSKEETRRIMRLAPMPYRLMWKWSVATGFRRFEVCGLPRATMPSPEQLALNDGGLVSFQYLRKGAREVSVYAPTALIEETNWYILTERPSPKDQRDAGRVFLSATGHAVSRQMLSREFRAVADSIGSKASLHHLRHTFAVNVLDHLERHRQDDEEINPLKAVQILLGHANAQTSEIYTQATSIANSAVMIALDSLFER